MTSCMIGNAYFEADPFPITLYLFAAGCSRDVIRRGADQLGWTLDDLITRTIAAVQTFEA